MHFKENGYIHDDFDKPIIRHKPIVKPPSCISWQLMEASLTNYHQNNLAIGLYKYFPKQIVKEVMQKYYVGTAKGNRTIFWQVNRKEQVRTGKVMQYNPNTLKREGYINWAHRILNIADFNLKQVFFGSHLLTDKTTPITIAEGEKNAIFGALYYPQFNWIAVGSIEMLNSSKLNAFKDYQVTLFPDKGKAFEKWSKIAQSACFDVHVNKVLENTSLKEGGDIADLVISIINKKFLSCPKEIIKKFSRKNPNVKMLIERFDLIT